MENEKEQSNLKDQLCHIFIYRKSTICLVCKRVISGKTNPDIRQERIVEHLRSFDHLESGRALFTMCISDPICDTEDGRCLDIVTKSVFDISVTLGEESSYICQKDKYLVCLMCRISISEITSFKEVIGNVHQHLRSTVHAISVKEVCWFYRLNSKNDYLLFHKSVLHCSICEETFQCLETKLLQTAVTHLATDRHEAKQQLSLLGLNKTRKLDRESPNNNKFCDNSEILEQKYSLDSIKSEVNVEMLNHIEYVDEDKMLNEPKCKGKRDIDTQTGQKQGELEQKYSLESIKSEVDVEMLNHIEYVDEDKTLNESKCKKRKRDIKMQTGQKQSKLEQKYSLESIKSEVDAEMLNYIEYVDEDKTLNEPKCKKGKRDMETQTGQKQSKMEGFLSDEGDDEDETLNEPKCKKGKRDMETQTGQKQSKMEGFLSDEGDDEDETLNEPKCKKGKRDIKTQTEQKQSKMEGSLSDVGDDVTPVVYKQFFKAVLKERSDIIKMNHQFVDLNDEGAFCILCFEHIQGLPNKPKKYLANLQKHFIGKRHIKMLREYKGENNDIPEELDSESLGWQVLGVEKSISQDSVTSESMSDGDENICSQTISSRTKGMEDKVCSHHRVLPKNKVLNKCTTCLKNIIRKVNSNKKKEPIYLTVRKKKCFCSLCQFYLTKINLASLTASYLDHCEGNSHKQRLEKHLLNIKKMKERRKLIKKMKKEENKGKVKKKPSAKAKKRRIKEKLKKNKQIKGKNNQK